MSHVPGPSSSSSSSSSSWQLNDVQKKEVILLPPIQGGNETDWSDWLFQCPKCPPGSQNKFPVSLLSQHKGWHARVNVLLHLRTKTTQDSDLSPFGPSQPVAVFVRVNYADIIDTFLDPNVTPQEMKVLFGRKCERLMIPIVYVERLKYTIGNSFMGRESQGEFVYFNIQDDDDHRQKQRQSHKGNYFSLECRDDGLWICVEDVKGLCPSTTASVNGIPLGYDSESSVKKEKGTFGHPSPRGQKLVFGDIVTLVVGEEEEEKGQELDVNKKKMTVVVDFLFQPSTKSSEKKVHDVDVHLDVLDQVMDRLTPLDNPLILQNVLSSLQTSTLKSLRPVSPLWNIEALKACRKRVLVSIFRNDTWLGLQPGCPKYYIQVSSFAFSTLNQVKFPHWKIHLPEEKEENEVTTYGLAEARRRDAGREKILDDLTWLLDPKHHSHMVTSLDLAGRVDSRMGFKLVETVFGGLRKDLTTLKFEPIFVHSSFPSSFSYFPALKSFSLILNPKDDRAQAIVKSFLDAFLPSVSNVPELNIHVYPGSNHSDPFFALVFQVMNKILSEGPIKFPKLNSLGLGGSGTYSLQPLASFPFASPLRKLELDLKPGTDDLTSLPTILEDHEIEELTLHYLMKGSISIHFPDEMPKLKTLAILFSVQADSPTVSFKFGLNPDHVTRIDYNRRFPSLSKLTVWPMDTFYHRKKLHDTMETWENFAPILTSFIQPKTEGGNDAIVPVPSIKVVDIPVLLRGKYNEVLDDLEVAFPNARFPPGLMAARQGRNPEIVAEEARQQMEACQLISSESSSESEDGDSSNDE